MFREPIYGGKHVTHPMYGVGICDWVNVYTFLIVAILTQATFKAQPNPIFEVTHFKVG